MQNPEVRQKMYCTPLSSVPRWCPCANCIGKMTHLLSTLGCTKMDWDAYPHRSPTPPQNTGGHAGSITPTCITDKHNNSQGHRRAGGEHGPASKEQPNSLHLCKISPLKKKEKKRLIYLFFLLIKNIKTLNHEECIQHLLHLWIIPHNINWTCINWKILYVTKRANVNGRVCIIYHALRATKAKAKG